MRASLSILLMGFLSLTISCAHKQPAPEVAKVEKKTEKAETAKEKADKELAYTCLVGKDARTVTLDKKEKRCEVHYTKFGDQQQVAWAESTPSICDNAFSNIRSNIEGSGYKCLEGSDVSFDKKEEKKEEKKRAVETAAN